MRPVKKNILLISPGANKRSRDSCRNKARDEKDSDQTLGKVVLFSVQGVQVWTLKPVRT